MLNKYILKLFWVLAFAFSFNQMAYAAQGDWGLGFGGKGKKPRGNESAEYLKSFDAYYVGESDEKVLYLTFDSGYENGYTESILDTLKNNDVKATFFLVGHYFESNPEIVRRMVEEGHIVGNHTMKHPDMSKITDSEKFKSQFTQVEDLYKGVTGEDIQGFFRPPQGRYSEQSLKMTQELGYKTIFWSLAYNDYDDKNQPSKEQAFEKLVPRVHPGAIILLHNTSKTNAEILDELIKTYKELGYEFKNLDYLTKTDLNTSILQND